MAKTYHKLHGTVAFATNPTEDNKKNVCTIEITPEQLEKLIAGNIVEDEGSKNFEKTPIKVDAETGKIIFKSGSQFDVDTYEAGTLLSEDEVLKKGFTLDEMGVGTEVILSFSVGETKYKGKKYQVAHLKAVNVIDFVPYEKVNPFEEDSETL